MQPGSIRGIKQKKILSKKEHPRLGAKRKFRRKKNLWSSPERKKNERERFGAFVAFDCTDQNLKLSLVILLVSYGSIAYTDPLHFPSGIIKAHSLYVVDRQLRQFTVWREDVIT